MAESCQDRHSFPTSLVVTLGHSLISLGVFADVKVSAPVLLSTPQYLVHTLNTTLILHSIIMALLPILIHG